MPTLNWIGKDKVISHHLDVPYRILEHKYGFTSDKGEQDEHTQSGNKIIHGDNLEALKSLLPEYEGKVKCIYIDPPYNTGNEGWVYNDNVNHPKIKKWLGEVVGKDGEDLTRHDKWLCMMYPRLQLLHKLLADDGAIFISIDDSEMVNLKLICDEIFGKNRFVSPIIWRSRQNVDSRNKTGISNDHEYILVYGKSEKFESFKGVEKDLTKFSNPDKDIRGPWRSADLTGIATIDQRPNLHFELENPKTGIVYSCPDKGWRYDRSTMAIKIAEDRVLFPKNKTGRPRNKIFQLEMLSSNKAFSSVVTEFTTGNGSNEFKAIFGNNTFSFPKPSEFIGFLVSQITSEDSIVLDSFAGSGTTAQAVLNLNKQDGGNRKFILVEMEDYANTITAERVKRVTKGYGASTSSATKFKVEGTGGAFDYYELGLPLFDADQNLNEQVDTEKIREYIWFSETRTAYNSKIDLNKYELGVKEDTVYYFIYEKNKLTTLDFDALELIKTKGEQYVIYADNCLLPKEFMAKNNIIFKKIPRDITKF